MVRLERRLGGSDAFVDIRQEDPSLRSSIRILEPFQHRSQGAISCVTGLFALVQEVVDREVRHLSSTSDCSSREEKRKCESGFCDSHQQRNQIIKVFVA